MEVILVKPQGMCKGVINAISLINKALNDDNIQKPLYMLGSLVHNKNVVNYFKSKGVNIILDTDKLKALNEIHHGTVIFTAHGVSPLIYQLALDKKLNIIDTTCKDVEKTHNIIKEKLKDGYKIIYCGIKNHPESDAVLGISKDISLLTVDEARVFKPTNNQKTFLINQTTLSYKKVLGFYEKIKQNYDNIEVCCEVCSASRLRQEAAIKQTKDSSMCIVVGDKMSNNTKTLATVIREENKIPVVLVEGIDDLKEIDFSNCGKIALTSGASTPKQVVDEIYEYLLRL